MAISKKKRSRPQTKTEKNDPSKKRTKTNFFTKLAFSIFVVFCVFSIYNMQTEISKLDQQKQSLQRDIDTNQESIAELKEDLAEPYDEAFIMKTAREKLGYSLPGEVVFYNDLTN